MFLTREGRLALLPGWSLKRGSWFGTTGEHRTVSSIWLCVCPNSVEFLQSQSPQRIAGKTGEMANTDLCQIPHLLISTSPRRSGCSTTRKMAPFHSTDVSKTSGVSSHLGKSLGCGGIPRPWKRRAYDLFVAQRQRVAKNFSMNPRTARPLRGNWIQA